MKKLLAILLAMTMLFALAGCGNNAEEVTNTDIPPQEETQNPDTEKETDKKSEADNKNQEKPDKKPAEKPADKPAEDKPAEDKPADKPAEDKPAEKPADKPAEEKPANKPADEKPAETPQTVGNALLAEFKSKAASSSSAQSIADAMAQSSLLPFMAGASPVEPGYLAGFTEEITDFKEGAMFGPMIGSIAFVGYVFVLDDSANVQNFISNLKKTADLRWNICVEAEEMVTGNVGNKVFFVMTKKSLDQE